MSPWEHKWDEHRCKQSDLSAQNRQNEKIATANYTVQMWKFPQKWFCEDTLLDNVFVSTTWKKNK